MTAPFDPDKARRHGQRTRDHEAHADSPQLARHAICATCGERIRYVSPPKVAFWLLGLTDYHRRPHWRHYPEVRVLCECGHDPDEHDMRAAPPACEVTGCTCGKEVTE